MDSRYLFPKLPARWLRWRRYCKHLTFTNGLHGAATVPLTVRIVVRRRMRRQTPSHAVKTKYPRIHIRRRECLIEPSKIRCIVGAMLGQSLCPETGRESVELAKRFEYLDNFVSSHLGLIISTSITQDCDIDKFKSLHPRSLCPGTGMSSR